MKFDIPSEVVSVCAALAARGHQSFVVGGAPRDLPLGRPVHDWDVATSALPDEVQATFPRTIPTGIKHGTVTVHHEGMEIEVTTFRSD